MNKLFLFLFFFGWLANAQHQDKVDFIHANVLIEPTPETKALKGSVSYSFEVLKDVDSVFLDAQQMNFSSVVLDKKKKKFVNTKEKIILRQKFKKGDKHVLTMNYDCQPKQTVYFSGWDDEINGNEQIWTQGQGKYTSHWLPSFDAMEEKVEFDLSFNNQFDGLSEIANGKLSKVEGNHKDGTVLSFNMQKPMSSYLLAFAIGNYDKQVLTSKRGIPIENYYYPKDSLKVEPTYRYTKEIFDFLEEEIGFSYPWQNYKQVPVHDFLYAGMENTSCTIFSDQYVIDSTAFVDKNYVNVNAHELAHQWFGNLVTEKDGNHHWLHEGFATYYAQLAEKEIFGDDHYYWKLYSSLSQLQDEVTRGKSKALTDPKASSLVFYEKGAWALYMLRNHIGATAFRNGVKSYLEKYKFKNVTIADFLKEMEKASGQDLSAFRIDWLENDKLPLEEAKRQLQKDSKSIAQVFSMEADLKKSQSDDIDYDAYWKKTNSIHLKKHILNTYTASIPENLWNAAFESDTIPVRQVISQRLDSIPPQLKSKFESLLNDKSYVTVESALFKLWASYPKEKAKFLEKAKDIIGLPNKNVRLLWLTLAILTNDYDGRNTQVYFKELNSYTSKEYGWEIRMGAFQYLNQALGLNQESLRNLVYATNHHSWQFKKFARNLVDELLKDEDYKSRFQGLVDELNEEETRYLKSKLEE